jgi:O-antigen ligase
MLMAAIVGIIILMIYANMGSNADRFGSFRKYLVFDNSWGTNRGYIWKASCRLWKDFSVEKKLIGYGPDTFGILTVKKLYSEMVTATGQMFDTAHNEYLQYLVTIGILGVISYVTFLITALIKMLKSHKVSPYCAAAAGGVLCYAAQATVNLNLPIATPTMWLLLSVGVALSRKTDDGVRD